MSYGEVSPPAALAPHVARLWWHTAPPARVLPDGCVDLVWAGGRLVVAGPATRAGLPGLPAGAGALGLRLRIGAAGAVLGVPAAELLDASPDAAELWGAGAAERVAAAEGPRERLAVLAALVAGRLRDAPPPDPLERAAVHALARPRARVGDVCADLAISERQLRRRFAVSVGLPPRTLARVLRLQRFLALAAGAPHDGLAALAARCGFADQAHLGHDVLDLCGLPPAALLATGAGAAGEDLRASPQRTAQPIAATRVIIASAARTTSSRS